MMDENARLRAGKRYRDGNGEVKGPMHSIHWENGERMLSDGVQVWLPDGTLPVAPAKTSAARWRRWSDADPCGKQGALSEGLAADQPPNPGTRGELLRRITCVPGLPRRERPASSGYRL